MPLYQHKVAGDTPAQARRRPWRLIYRAWDPAKQAWTRKCETFRTKGEAEQWRADNGKDIRTKRHTPRSDSLTVQQAAAEWIAAREVGLKRGKGRATASTLRQYRYHADTYIIPRLGSVKLCDLAKADIETFANGMLKSNSPVLTRKVLTSLKSILTHRDVSLPFPNVGVAHEGKVIDRKTITAMKQDVPLLLAKLDELAAQPNRQRAKAWRRYRALIAVAVHTGMRSSEIRGLPWDGGVDLKGGTVHVGQRADENGTVEPVTKSAAGERDISIPTSLVSLLKEWKLEAGGHALIFATDATKRHSGGKPISGPNIYNRAWKPLQLAAGVTVAVTDANGNVQRDSEGVPLREPRYNFHMLRHFFASRLIESGLNPAEIKDVMGHSSIKITYDTYGHLFDDEKAAKRRANVAERLASELAT